MFKKFIWSLLTCLLATLFVYTKAPALDKRGATAITHYILGVMYEDLGDVDQAIEEYKKVSKADPESSLIPLNLASSYIKKNDIPKAIEELNHAVKLDPGAVEPHAILALVYYSLDKSDMAEAEYETALKNASVLQPENINIYKGLGLMYVKQKKYKDAEKTYKLILDLSANDAEAHFYLGDVYYETNEKKLAEKDLKRAIELKPDYHEALNFLGYLYVDENRNLTEAEGLIKKALELSPDNSAYIDSLGWLYFKKGKFKEAVKELEKAILMMEDPIIFDHLGDAYLKIKDPEKAKLNWQQSLTLDPNQESVKKKLEKLK